MWVQSEAETTFNEGDQVYWVFSGTGKAQGPYVVASGPPFAFGPPDITTKKATRIIPLLNPSTGESLTLNSFELVKAEDYARRGELTPS